MAPRSSSTRAQSKRQRTFRNSIAGCAGNPSTSDNTPDDLTSHPSLRSLPPDLLLSVCSHLPPNEVACSLRLCCKALRDALNAPQHRVVRLSQPVPPQAFKWALHSGIPFGGGDCSRRGGSPTLDGLTLDDKETLSEMVAGAGVLQNLIMLNRDAKCPGSCSTPCAAAAAGHLHVLQWLDAEAICLSCLLVHETVGERAPLAILQWYDQRCEIDPAFLFESACRDEDADRREAKLRFLHNKYGNRVISSGATEAAASRGHVATLPWLREVGANVHGMALCMAAEGGHVATAAWLLENSHCTINALVVFKAAAAGHVEMLGWLERRFLGQQAQLPAPRGGWRRGLVAAACGGHLAAVQWLLPRAVDLAGTTALELAAEGGHCEVMRALLAAGCPPTRRVFDSAARAGSIPALQLLVEAAAAQAAEKTATAMSAGIGTGTGAGTEGGMGATAAAANAPSAPGGEAPSDSASAVAAAAVAAIMHPRAYKMAALSLRSETSNNPSSDAAPCGGDGSSNNVRDDITAGAISTGHSSGSGSGGDECGSGAPSAGGFGRSGRHRLDVLQWLEGRGCPLGDAEERGLAAGAAASVGSRPRLEWLRARGCEWGARTFTAAAYSGCIGLVEWMAREGCPMGRRGDALLAAAANSDFAMLHALRRLGCPWAADVLPRAVCGELPRGPAGWGVAGRPVRCGLPVLRWLVAHGCPVTKQAYDAARRSSRYNVAEWLKRGAVA